MARPKSPEEEIVACREQLKVARACLREANLKLAGLNYYIFLNKMNTIYVLVKDAKLQSLIEENRRLRLKRGLECQCNGSCSEHFENKGEFFPPILEKFSTLNHHVGSLPVPKKRVKKRKPFDQLTVKARREGLKDIRMLLKDKEAEY